MSVILEPRPFTLYPHRLYLRPRYLSRDCVAEPSTRHLDPPCPTCRDEFEFIAKTLVRRAPQSYLEWGAGLSTSWLPLLATRTYVIELQRAWCDSVRQQPVVACLEATRRLLLTCVNATRADGSPVTLRGFGLTHTRADALEIGTSYVGALAHAIPKASLPLDAALVDGRFRAAAALALLPLLSNRSVVLVHDFWTRPAHYAPILRHYDVIGRARTVAALRRKVKGKMARGHRHGSAAASQTGLKRELEGKLYDPLR